MLSARVGRPLAASTQTCIANRDVCRSSADAAKMSNRMMSSLLSARSTD
jgi:hypothetical protein